MVDIGLRTQKFLSGVYAYLSSSRDRAAIRFITGQSHCLFFATSFFYDKMNVKMMLTGLKCCRMMAAEGAREATVAAAIYAGQPALASPQLRTGGFNYSKLLMPT